MVKIVFRLSSVADEEADGVRKTLEDAGVYFYETSAGKFGWSLPAIWVKNNEDYELARNVIEEFQDAYIKTVKASPSSRSHTSKWKIYIAIILSIIVLYIFNAFWIHRWI